MADNNPNLTAIFKTKSQYVLPPKKYMIPSSWARYHLSQLINKVLELGNPVPFDFLINGQVLRGSLAQWCTEKGVSTEENIEIEYVESMLPPQRLSTIEQDEWVSAVSCSIPGHFLSASYDGSLRLYNTSKALLQTVTSHAAPITSTCLIGPLPKDVGTDSCLVASTSQDMTAALTRLSLSEGAAGSQTLASLHLHTAPVSSIDCSPSGSTLLTGSWDSLLGVWSALVPDKDDPGLDANLDDVRSRKRRKTDGQVKQKAPLEVLRSHTGRISQVKFVTEAQAVSCGWDSTVRKWDLTTSVCDGTITAAEKPFTSLAVLSQDQIFAASTDRTLSLYDLSQRTIATTAQLTFMHPSFPSCISRSPSDQWRVLTGAYDGVVRIWDIRSVKTAISAFRASKSGKVLSTDWTRGLVAVGGEDGMDIWKVSDDGALLSNET